MAKKVFVSSIFLVLPKEKIIFRVHPHWLFIVLPELALAFIGYLFFKYFPIYWPEKIYPIDKVLIIFSVIWFFVMLIVFLYWICINYYLTNLRLIEERGIIGKRIMSIWLDKIQDITCSFGILGRIFGFGNLEIQSAGTYGKIVFNFIPKPRKLKEEIEKAILEYKKAEI
ncbi:MAG: PH domain-containing protein [Patescibacteria group bacterium]|nr:PH domain-containing protein [Patescibacteria group bacterium]